MQPLHRLTNAFAATLLLALVAPAAAQDANITQPVADLEQLLAAEPLVITQAQISRPKAKGDITLRADVSFGGSPPLRVKLRKAEPGANSFNNVPRYDLAAYELQKLFLDAAEYVVPPTTLRMVPLADFARYSPDVVRTFPGADQVVAVVQYWLSDILVIADVYNPERFATDPVYARHIGQLNVLTYLIEHRDSNVGNFLIGKGSPGARVFSIDHGVAFASEDSDRGDLWRNLRVASLPADTVERLRRVTPQVLADKLGVLAQWRLEDGQFRPVSMGGNLGANRGVRREGRDLQMGLTRAEMHEVYRLLTKLLEQVDRGKISHARTGYLRVASMLASRCPKSGILLTLLTLLTLLIIAITCDCHRAAQAQGAQLQWNGIDRVIAFADVHGAYTELVTLLRETGVVDAQDHWNAGRTHVVSLGDLLDRGADSRKVMDLLMRLQGEALAAGGYLHVVLGNHEAMNVLGDLRYVEAGEFASYVDLESPADRVDQKVPGYVGHRAAFAPDGKYGQWLLSLPVAIMVNDTLFMHAGPAKLLQGMSLQEVNLRYRTALTDYLGLEARLEQASLLQAGDPFEARPKLARDRLTAATAARGGAPDAVLTDAVQRFEVAASNPLLSEDGPNWYRGAALCNEVIEADVLSPLLRQFGAVRLVVGHTPTRDSRAVTRFDGRVVKLDAGMNRAAYRGRPAALLLEPSGLSVRYAGESAAVPLNPEGLFVAPNELDDAGVLAALRDGELSVTGPLGPNELNVSVSHAGKRIPAVFQVRSANAARSEVAAYKLDRLLGLGFVPVTVERELQGQHGVVQGRPLKWVTQAQVQQQALRGGGWCSVEPQFQLMYAFDTLIGNEGRTAESILFDSSDWFVYGTSHERAFGASRGLPAYLRARPPNPGAEVRRRLGALDEAGLTAALGDLVDPRGLKAILVRRDALLALPAVATAAK